MVQPSISLPLISLLLTLLTLLTPTCYGAVKLGVDCFFQECHYKYLTGKKIGLITNHTGVNSQLLSTIDLFLEQKSYVELIALFSPEHGLHGNIYASHSIGHKKSTIPVYSLHGETKRPTPAMLKGIDILVYDIQEIGSRSYTYSTTLFYAMEEAAKQNIELFVFDRPNPLNGNLVDGPMLERRSFLGYIDVPYCHGMTIGELALFFNGEYQIGCKLKVIPMQGWERGMSFADTGLSWIPTSPYIPEQDTPFFYPSTGIIGELGLVNIGIGYTQPFKLIGAPWIEAGKFASHLNQQKLPGVAFIPYSFRPMYGIYKGEDCHGIKILITDKKVYKPVSVQYLILGSLKSLYPHIVKEKLRLLPSQKRESFILTNGTDQILSILQQEPYPAWKLIEYDAQKRKLFIEKRKKYLLY